MQCSDAHDEENMVARPDKEEMEQAINKFLQLLEKQEKQGFKDLATLLSQLPKPAQGSARSMSVAGYGGWFSPRTGQRSGRYVHPVGVAPVPTRSGPQITNPDILRHPSLFVDVLG